MFREAALDLIGSVDMDKGRERMLMKLADGKPYRCPRKIFPQLCGSTTDKAHPPAAGCGGEPEDVPYGRTSDTAPERFCGSGQLPERIYGIQRCTRPYSPPVSRQPRSQYQCMAVALTKGGKRPKRGAIWRDSQPCQSHTTTWAYSACRKETGTRRRYTSPRLRQQG